MRNKIKQLMNKEEGFTLVELLAVIVILGIIVAIAIPSVGGIINRAQGNADEAEQELVIDAARLYVTEKGFEAIPDDGLTVQVLIDDGFLEDIRESTTDDDGNTVAGAVKESSSLSLDDSVTVDKNSNQTYSYSFVEA